MAISAFNSFHFAAVSGNQFNIASQLFINDPDPIAVSLSRNGLLRQELWQELRDHLSFKFSLSNFPWL
jgi:hypothetical protein